MSDETITAFIRGIANALTPSGHLLLWVDKFHLCTGVAQWLNDWGLEVVDLVTWNKGKMGMGYRTRRYAEHLVIAQKPPKRAKGVWQRHDIPDVWTESIDDWSAHAHAKTRNSARGFNRSGLPTPAMSYWIPPPAATRL